MKNYIKKKGNIFNLLLVFIFLAISVGILSIPSHEGESIILIPLGILFIIFSLPFIYRFIKSDFKADKFPYLKVEKKLESANWERLTTEERDSYYSNLKRLKENSSITTDEFNKLTSKYFPEKITNQ